MKRTSPVLTTFPILRWPGWEESDAPWRREVMEGYFRASRNVEAFLRSRKRQQVFKRFREIHEQDFGVRIELFVARRELACARFLHSIRDLARDAGAPEGACFEVLINGMGTIRSRWRKGGYDMRPVPDQLWDAPDDNLSMAFDVTFRDGLPKTRWFRGAPSRVRGVLLEAIEKTDAWAALAFMTGRMDDALRWLQSSPEAPAARCARALAEDGPFGPARLTELTDEVARLEAYAKQVSAELDQLRERLNVGAAFALEPLDDWWERHEDVVLDDPWLIFLTMLRLAEMRFRFTNTNPREDIEEFPIRAWEHLTEIPRRDFEFWWLLLQGVLSNSGGISAEGVVAAWVPELLAQFLAHPSRFSRLPGPKAAAKARSALARRLGPFAHQRTQEHRAFEAEWITGEPTPESALVWAGVVLGQRQVDDKELQVKIPDSARALLKPLILEFIVPFGHEILLAMWRAGSETGPVEPEAPAEDEAVFLERVTAVAGLADAVAKPKPVEWDFVYDPVHGGRSAPLGQARVSRAEVFEQFFRECGIPVLIKAKSVVRALMYYERMPEEVRHTLPAEYAHGERWAKLKRGRLRILVREVGPGKAWFHVYPRKEWVGPMEFA